VSGAQNFADFRLSIIKYPLQSFFYNQAVEKTAKDTVRDGIMDAVDKLDTFWGRLEFVVVIPERIRANSLFIDKRFFLTNMLYLGKPSLSAKYGYGNPILDNQPVKHVFRDSRDNQEMKVSRSDQIQVSRIFEKIPTFI